MKDSVRLTFKPNGQIINRDAAKERTPYDGRPYYCDNCRRAFVEYVGCDKMECSLEPIEEAQRRAYEYKAAAIADLQRRHR